MAQQIDAQFARDFLQRLHAAANAHDADAVAALCAEDVVWQDPVAPLPLHGREAVRRFHRDMMFQSLPDARIELVDGPYLSLDGTGVAVRLRIGGTMTGPMEPPGFAPTGRRVEFETAGTSKCLGRDAFATIKSANMRIPRYGEVGWYDGKTLQWVWKGSISDARYEFGR